MNWRFLGWFWLAFTVYYSLAPAYGLASAGLIVTVKFVTTTALCLFCFAVHELLEVLRGRW